MRKILSFILAAVLLAPSSAFAAIAADNSSQGALTGNPTGTSLSYALNVGAGANRFLIVSVHTYNALDNVSTVTYNGTAMTRLLMKQFTSDTNQRLYYYYLYNPDSGNNNVVVTLSTGSLFSIMYSLAASFTGVAQSGFPDASSSGTANSNADVVGTVTTVADNAWPVMLSASDDDNSATAGASTAVIIASSAGANPNRDALSQMSSPPKTPAGSVSLTIDVSAATAGTAYIIASMAPAASATTVVQGGQVTLFGDW